MILTALEVLGYRVVASSSTAVKQDYNEYMWTMRKEFNDPEPFACEPSTAISASNAAAACNNSFERDNLTNLGREVNNYPPPPNNKIDVPE